MSSPDARQHDLFAPLDEAQWARVQAEMTVLRRRPGAVLFQRGDPADSFYYVRAGAVKLLRRNADGHEKVIEVIQEGQTFAEAVMFLSGEYPVEAVVLREAELLAFDSAGFRELLRGSPDACLAMLGRMARRVHAHLSAVDALTLQSAQQRVVEYIVSEAGAGPGFHLAFPKHVLASRLGMTPESLSRVLSELRRGGLIEVRASYVQLRDRAGLEALRDVGA